MVTKTLIKEFLNNSLFAEKIYLIDLVNDKFLTMSQELEKVDDQKIYLFADVLEKNQN